MRQTREEMQIYFKPRQLTKSKSSLVLKSSAFFYSFLPLLKNKISTHIAKGKDN